MMNHVLFGTVLIAGLVAMSGALVCNYCALSMEEDCLGNSSKTMTCAANERCYISTLNLTSYRFRTKGCVKVNNSQCNGTPVRLDGLNASVVLNTTCCDQDQCNGATSLDIGLPAVIIAALVAVWSSYKQ